MDPDYLFDQVALTLEGRLKALELLWNDLAWDLFTIVFTETDRLFHFFYPLRRRQHPLSSKAAEFMNKWDHAIGVVLDNSKLFREIKAYQFCGSWLRCP